MDTQNDITLFAKTNFRNKEVPFGIKTDDRRRHMYIIGKTGMGKTTLMENMIIQDIVKGNGICFVDPHGDSVEKILDYIPSSRVNDVMYFNPADMDFPIAFNILEAVDPRYKHLVASGLMGVFTKIWAGVWSARMEYIMNNSILALLDSPGNTLLGITRMLIDKKYRKKIVDNIKDPMVKSFWADEFANWPEKYRTESIAPIQNKVGQFLSSSMVRNIVGQSKSTLDLREIMDDKKILLMNLSKGRIGEDNSALLGAMIITKLQLAALSRVDIDEKERSDFYLYVDEFQNFATESFATILSEARKYRLNLIVGHQYIGQLVQEKNTKVRDAVFGNVGTIVTFRIGAGDAEFLEKEFAPIFTETDLVNLPKYTVILKLMINGVASDPFTAVTLDPSHYEDNKNAEKVIRVSRERYANPVAQVEDKILRWMGQDFHEQVAVIASTSPLAEIDEEEIAEALVPAAVNAGNVVANVFTETLEQSVRASRSLSPMQAAAAEPQESPSEVSPAQAVFSAPILQTQEQIKTQELTVPKETVMRTTPNTHRDSQASMPANAQTIRRFTEPQRSVSSHSQNQTHHTGKERRRENRPVNFERRRNNSGGRHYNNPQGQAQSYGSSHGRPTQKKDNPIWSTVNKMTTEKVRSTKQLIQELSSTTRPAPDVKKSTSQAAEISKIQVSRQENPLQSDIGRKILKPGEAHKID